MNKMMLSACINNALTKLLKIFKCTTKNSEGFEENLKAKRDTLLAADEYLKQVVVGVDERLNKRLQGHDKDISLQSGDSSVSGGDIPVRKINP